MGDEPQGMPSIDVGAMRKRVHDIMPGSKEALERLVAIPSVAFAAYPREPVERAAQMAAELLRAAGMPEVRFVEVPPDPPAVYAARPAALGAPTVLLYAHYDVQPAGLEERWESPPYESSVRGGRLYGRGSADDKAGIVAHLGALRALGSDSPVGLKVLLDGAEETGSLGLEAYIPAHPDLVAADAVIVCDLGNVAVGKPTLTTSLRGIATLDVTIESLAAPVHSGSYGGAVPDALVALIRLLATLHDERGRSAVAGLSALPYRGTSPTEDELRADAGVLPGVDLVGDGPLGERLFTGPAINVIGMDVPDVDSATNAVIAKARARVSVRVAPSQDPAEAGAAVARHLQARVPWHVQATIVLEETGHGYLAEAGGRGHHLARWALAEASGLTITEIGEGGSIPLVAAFHAAAPEADLILLGVADPSSHIHAPNESVDLDELERCTLAEALFLAGLADGADSRHANGVEVGED